MTWQTVKKSAQRLTSGRTFREGLLCTSTTSAFIARRTSPVPSVCNNVQFVGRLWESGIYVTTVTTIAVVHTVVRHYLLHDSLSAGQGGKSLICFAYLDMKRGLGKDRAAALFLGG